MGLCENRVYSQWNSHLIGIMISKTIGFRGTLFSDTPIWPHIPMSHVMLIWCIIIQYPNIPWYPMLLDENFLIILTLLSQSPNIQRNMKSIPLVYHSILSQYLDIYIYICKLVSHSNLSNYNSFIMSLCNYYSQSSPITIWRYFRYIGDGLMIGLQP